LWFWLGYFIFNAIGLNYNTHLPWFYTAFVFLLLSGSLDIGIAMSLFTNSFVIYLLASDNEHVRKNSFLIIGSILAINFIFSYHLAYVYFRFYPFNIYSR
jgi:hypothetical protein